MTGSKSYGPRHKTRDKLSLHPRMRGKVPVTWWLKEFSVGQKVVIKIVPSVHVAMPHPKFYGKVGEVVGKRGRCYLVKVYDGKKPKIIISHPIHLWPA
ncbi:MAG: 50S ribosomal protein L21e [bacterium]|nr:50S ribosomal protein L21e [bacterium]